MNLLLGIIGDYKPGLVSHQATDCALRYASEYAELRAEWVGTELIEERADDVLRVYDAFLCAPGSPYRSFAGALRGLRFARENLRPLLATCGGFQHMVVEFARNVLGRFDVQHPEYNPDGPLTFVTPLLCNPAGSAMDVHIDPATRVFSIYGNSEASEIYHCSFEVSPEQQGVLHDAGLRIAAVDNQGHARIIELSSHPFYVGTLFIPQMHAQPGRPHPLVLALVKAAQEYRRTAPVEVRVS